MRVHERYLTAEDEHGSPLLVFSLAYVWLIW